MITELLISFSFLLFLTLFLFCGFYCIFREGSSASPLLLRTSIGSLFYSEQKLGLMFALWSMNDISLAFLSHLLFSFSLSHSCLSNMGLGRQFLQSPRRTGEGPFLPTGNLALQGGGTRAHLEVGFVDESILLGQGLQCGFLTSWLGERGSC